MRLFAVFSYRYDVELVPDLLENLKSFIDDYVIHDDRGNTEEWYNEGYVRNKLIEKAKNRGADWILCVDPDERFEIQAGKKIRDLIKIKRKVIYLFNFRELWLPCAYRVDGIWGQKKKAILFPVFPGQKFMNLPIHSGWFPINEDYEWINTDINLYHLKMIVPEARKIRANLYKSLDPFHKYQPIGYDYLIEEIGLRLERIPPGREYYPPFKESYIDVLKYDPITFKYKSKFYEE